MNINNLSEKPSIKEQREELLKLNNDLLFGVYSLRNESNEKIELDFLENVLTCYPNQLNNLKGLEKNLDITILNLGSLRKGNVEILNGPEYKIDNPVLLSNGVIEFIESKNNNGKSKKHLISTLRDGAAADELQRTTTAGRNSGNDLNEDLEREHIEESPFLGYNDRGELSLATIDNSEESKSILKESIQFFLENKYFASNNENYNFVVKNFERNFPGIKYSELGNILKEIIDNDRIYTYNVNSLDSLNGYEEDFKEVVLGKSKGNYFVYFDKANNTIEYRLLRELKGFNNGFKTLSKRPSRLYLESENQYPKFSRIEKSQNGYVPTIKYFSEKYEEIIK